ncbi:outer membrane beta-barrel protein [Hufsiella ginkgonis]|uniref:Outer membrane protein beta-barrel domain-containing protein n=1 Tax=Hufsiella ginkgonis TaxID=2695274 RepID=A0A7K1XSI9_9SPHI|nr:outer membrane beta-barrel protein [Hufsiella ginkgonis]MXV13699.1 hypothetical protein [Hufsiella ginkgonis]
MKRFLIILLLPVFSAQVFAQVVIPPYTTKPRLGVGAEFGIPSGSFGNVFTIGFGGSGKFEVPITREFYATATAGFTTFYLKEDMKPLTINKSYVPLKVGGKYYFGNYFFGEGELGLSIGTNKNAGSAFVWAPGAGISFPVTKDGYIDAGVRYERWARDGGNINQAGFRIAYKF